MKEIFANSLQLIIDKFVLGIPNLLMAILITIMGFTIAKFISKILKSILQRIKIDKFGEMFNDIEIIRKNDIKIRISGIVSQFIYYVLILIFLIAATDILQMEALSNLVKNMIEFIPNLIVAIAILIMGLLAADKIRVLISTACDSLGIPSGKIIASFVFYFVIITVFIMALSQAKIDTAFLAQNLSIIIGGVVLAFSIGYGFASKELVSNYIASYSLKGKYNIGDKISLQNIEGIITEIDKTSVVIKSEDKSIIVPIHRLVSENVIISK